MTGRAFLDTNVLVYAYDRHDPAKQQRAQSLLLQAMEGEDAVISTQVLGEFYVAMTRRLREPLSPAAAGTLVRLLSALPVVEIDLPLVHRALMALQRYQLSYWDSLILAAAERGNCATVLTEDLNPGQVYLGVTVQNPFAGQPA